MENVLLDKKNFYQNLLQQIRNAKKNIVFDAFIWIDDNIGRNVAQACLDAADRGVKIFIRKDTSASLFEHTPGRLPLFFDNNLIRNKKFYNQQFGLLTSGNFNRLGYLVYGKKPRPILADKSALAKKIERHKNIFLQILPFFNHGKLILIDEIAYIGGQCISNDYEQWIDYSVKIQDTRITKSIWCHLLKTSETVETADTQYMDNEIPETKNMKKNIHHFLKNFIETSTEELIIEMAYLGRWYIPILKKSLQKGIKITMLISKHIDANHHTNMWVVSDLIRLKMKNLTLIFSNENMVHTKGLATRKKMTIGSANFHGTCRYFYGHNEQNIFSENSQLVNSVFSRFQADCSNGEKITDISQLPKWSKKSAILEILSISISNAIVFWYRKKIIRWRKLAAQKLQKEYNKS